MIILWPDCNNTLIVLKYYNNRNMVSCRYEPKKMMELKRGESTLQENHDFCHIVLFFRGPIFEL
jgi:hypothetical protein